MRWLVLLLLIANLGVFIWGWFQDSPGAAPLPPLPQGTGQIRLLSEPPVPDEPAASPP